MPVAEAPSLAELLDSAAAPEPRAPRRRRGAAGDLALTAGVAVAAVAAVLPIARLILPTWLPAAIAVVVLALGAGWALRRAGLPGAVSALGEAVMWLLCATVSFGHEDALLGFLPTAGVVEDLPRVFGLIADELAEGVAPMTPSHELWFLLVAAAGVVAILVGLVVRAAHLPLLGAAILITVFAIPQLAVPGDPDLLAAALLAGAVLWIARTEIRIRRPGMEAGIVASTWAAVLGVGAVLAALILAPLVPLGDAVGGGIGRTARITATLDLGDDLRRPEDVEVLQVRSDGAAAPYLRVATLTRFDGEQWQPDGTAPGPLEFGDVVSTAPVEERTTTLDITRLTSAYLPLPYPAVGVEGAAGMWSANPLNRTAQARDGTSALGQHYVVTSQELRPTREQARAVMPRGDGDVPFSFSVVGVPEITNEALVLPDDVQASLRDTALDVIGDAGNAYDALIAMQSWFRSDGGFAYSLEAPVEDGFDGSGMDAISRFLEVRSGYCVHFASTFAVMSRSLGIPSRVVVGFLPGEATGDRVDDQEVYSVLGSQLHAWPEAYLEGIGWVPFEPTTSLGTPTSLRSEAAPGATPTTAPSQSAAPTLAPTRSAEQDRGDIDNPTGTQRAFDPTALLRALGIVIGALVLCSVPAAIRAVRWSTRLAAARRGDAGAAWRELQDLVIDAGSPVDESKSPRVFAARLMREHGVPAKALDPLVTAIERASFAPPSGAEGADLARSLQGVRRVLLPVGRDRLRAAFLPRSLLIRPAVTEH